jgi:magnesium transporter
VVIGLFETTLDKIVILAVLMPIVASMGGNAGTQTLTVAVRALAMKELTPANAFRVLSKEVLVGLLNGLMFAVLIGLIAWFWSGDIGIGAVIAVAMVITLVIAGLAGTAIPLWLSHAGIDPAIGSGVILTTITDVIAFAVFLGFAAWFLL